MNALNRNQVGCIDNQIILAKSKNKPKGFQKGADIYNMNGKNHKTKEHQMIELYMDGNFLGWGVWNKISSYRSNGWTVVVTHF